MFRNTSMLSTNGLKDRNKMASKSYRDRKKQQEQDQVQMLTSLEDKVKVLQAENKLLKTQASADYVSQQLHFLTYEIQKLSAIVQNQPIPPQEMLQFQQQPQYTSSSNDVTFTNSNTSTLNGNGVVPIEIKQEDEIQHPFLMDLIDEPSNNFMFVFLLLIILVLPAFIFPNLQVTQKQASNPRILYNLKYQKLEANSNETGVQVQGNYDFDFDKYQDCIKFAESGLDLFGFQQQKLEDYCKDHCQGMIQEE